MILEPNKERNGFSVPSEHNKSLLSDWLKKYSAFNLEPRINETIESRGFLEGAVVPAYCEWQYGVSAKDLGKSEQRRFLFKSDFNYEILKDRDGNPKKSPVSSKGLAQKVLQTFTRYAEENGCPIPNPDLYKLWKQKWSMDNRFPTYFDFLDFLDLQVDAMPSDQTLNKLGVKGEVDYPENNLESPVF